MDLFSYYPALWNQAVPELLGLIIIALSLISLALIAARRDTLVTRTLALANGASIGLAGGVFAGIALLFAQTLAGSAFLLAPIDFQTGLRGGIALGALALLAVGALITSWNAAVLGLLAGAGVAMVIFSLIFGAATGNGGEIMPGISQEVAIMAGVAGGVLGGIAGHAIRIAARNMRMFPDYVVIDASTPMRPQWRWPLIGLTLGALASALGGGLGAYMGIFEFLVPYSAQSPDASPGTATLGTLQGILFGLGLFAISGALIGCFLMLQWMTSGGVGARRYGVWLGVGLVTALICGLSFGLSLRGADSGPVPMILDTSYIRQDPVAGMRGLLVGLAGGAVIGMLLLWLARFSQVHARWQMVARQGIVIAVGLLLITLPLWYMPLVGVAIR